MNDARYNEMVDFCRALILKLQEKLIVPRSYNELNDESVVRTRGALSAPVRIRSVFGDWTIDLTMLSDADKEIVVAMGWIASPCASDSRCPWCSSLTTNMLQDRQLSYNGCTVKCMIGQLVFSTGMFKTRAIVKKYLAGGAKNAKKESSRVRVPRVQKARIPSA